MKKVNTIASKRIEILDKTHSVKRGEKEQICKEECKSGKDFRCESSDGALCEGFKMVLPNSDGIRKASEEKLCKLVDEFRSLFGCKAAGFFWNRRDLRNDSPIISKVQQFSSSIKSNKNLENLKPKNLFLSYKSKSNSPATLSSYSNHHSSHQSQHLL
ncbi:unnamed protein product [Moneuplotes crassus]|uniref:Uncharacterized protein n=1 Tax=Euplotes crassus TaxID=5936 RepID=A0AAD1Y5K2_EUPCR|nr:unnamed protein product [Moneuplotes crassus]